MMKINREGKYEIIKILADMNRYFLDHFFICISTCWYEQDGSADQYAWCYRAYIYGIMCLYGSKDTS